MPRKPSSVFLIAEDPNTTFHTQGMPASALKAWRLPIPEGHDTEQVVKAHYTHQPVGTRLYVVDDTKVAAFEVSVELAEVDDARLDTDA